MSTPGKAYSYKRFSTPEQAEGDSLRRQTALAEAYVKRHGLTLDTELTMHDLGVSAYRGKNLAGDACLGAFLAAVKDGDVAPGSVLLVESLDRISRKDARKAVRVLEEIVDAGVDVVTLSDNEKRYSKESLNGFDFIMAVLILMRANEESKTKGSRVALAWAAKRAGKAGQGYGKERNAFTSMTPGWIRLTEDGRRELITGAKEPARVGNRALVVRWIFSAFVRGAGQHAIAHTLNRRKVPTFGRAICWHRSYIAKILKSCTVVGVLVPHTDDSTTRTPQAPIEGYYPAVIDLETWNQAQTLAETNAKHPGANKSTLPVQNILAGLAKCPHCGGSMTRVWKGLSARAVPKLVCAWAKTGGACRYVSVSLPEVEAALRRAALDPLPEADGTLRDQLMNRRGELEGLENTIEDLVAAVEHSASKALLARLKAREEQRDRLAVELAALEKQAEGSESKLLKRRVERYRAAMSAKPFDVSAANVALREMVNKVTVDYEEGVLRMHWRHDGESQIVYDAATYGAARAAREFKDLGAPGSNGSGVQ